MRNYEFSPEEVEVMRDVLKHKIQELRLEVLHTDSSSFKTILKQRQMLLESALEKLVIAGEPAPA